MAVVCKNRSHLLLGCGATALAASLVLVPERVSAQAFQATPVVVQGNANIDRAIPSVDSIEVTTPVAVIDWTPLEDGGGNALDFLPTGATAFFFDAPGQGGFSVLNRILPATNGNVVVMNGTVVSSLQDGLGNFTPGGFVAFYSPTGFLIGSNAVFDIGSLMFTTLDPNLTSFENFALGAGPLNLIGQTGTTASITINSGAQIVGTAENSFFIATGAQVNVFGNVAINGSHAYVAAEQVNLTYSNGLFDIVIPVGTSVGNALTLDGNITGPASNGAGDNHLIYAVAKAQANPVSMFFSGNLGFAPAVSAGIVNGEIILSAGSDVTGNVIGPDNGVDASIQIENALISSSVTASASRDFFALANAGPVLIDGDLTVSARNLLRIHAIAGEDLSITGSVAAFSGGLDTGPDQTAGTIEILAADGSTLSVAGDIVALANPEEGTGARTGGLAILNANGGLIQVGGSVDLQAVANGTPGGIATGGNATLFAHNAGSIEVGGNVTLDSTALGSEFSPTDAFGGQSDITAIDGSSITIGGEALLLSNAFGGNSLSIGSGGSGSGGDVFITAGNGGQISIAQSVAGFARGTGGNGESGGTGSGGLVSASANGAGSTLNLGQSINLDSTGTGGEGFLGDGGDGIGGTTGINAASGGAIDIATWVNLLADSFGGLTTFSGGGSATGGRARMSVFGGTIDVGDFFRTSAQAFAGDGVDGGDAAGGIAGAFAGVGSISIATTAEAFTTARGGQASEGFGGSGGNGVGGNAFIQAEGNLAEDASIAIGGETTVHALGFGGAGGSASAGLAISAGRGGDGRGGLLSTPNAADPAFGNGAFVLAQGDRGSLIFGGDVFINSSGVGGQGGAADGALSGGEGGDGFGGTAQGGLFIGTGNGSVSAGSVQFGNITIEARGDGGFGGLDSVLDRPTGNGGNGTGGNAFLTARLSTTTAGNASIFSGGTGGNGAIGGNGTGGQSGLLAGNNGTANIGQLIANSSGNGGTSFNGNGGSGTGGNAFIGFQGGTANISGDALISAIGFGGEAFNGDGGDGTGGLADIASFTPIQGNATIGGLARIHANGIGGTANSADFTGGNGAGGQAFLLAQAGSTLQINIAQISAGGEGGSGPQAKGGNGLGGLAYIRARDSGSSITINEGPLGPFNPVNQSALVGAIGFGGQSNGGDGIGGTGTGGTVDVAASSGGSIALPSSAGSLGSLRLFARGFGGASTVEGGAGGLGVGGIGSLTVDAGTLTAGPLHLSAFGQGGSSAMPSANIAGGDGQGGQRFITVINGGTLTAGFPAGVAGGSGGLGSGTANGGNGSGGLANLEVIGGTANLVGRTIVLAINTGGDAIDGDGGSAAGGQANLVVDDGGVINLLPDGAGLAELLVGANARAGESVGGDGGDALPQGATAVIGGGAINGGILRVESTARAGFSDNGTGGLASGGDASLLLDGGTLTLVELYINADAIGGGSETGTNGAALGGGALLQAANGSVNTSGGTVVTARATSGVDPALLAVSSGGGDALGGAATIRLQAGSTLTAGQIQINGNAQAFQSGNAGGGQALLTLTSGQASTVGNIELTATASSGGGLSASGGDAVVELTRLPAPAASSVLTASQLVATTGAGGASSNSAGGVALSAVGSQANLGTVVVSALASNGGQNVLWTANGSSFLVPNAIQVEASGDITVTAINGSLIGGPTVTAPTAFITMETPGTITFNGNNDNAISFGGATMSLNSGELDINPGARIGANEVFLVSLDTNHTAILGGTTEEVGYTLTAAEVERIEAGTARFSAPVIAGLSANQPDLLIRDVTLAGSLDDGPSSVSIITPGIIRIEGVLAYLDAASTDTLEIVGGERIEIVTPGGVAVLDSAGNPSGELFLGSEGSIWAADAALITQLQADPNFAGRNDLLRTPATGSDDPLGYIRGGSVSIAIDDSLLVRNTGTEAEPGGILVGAGGLTIGTFEASSLLDVFAYGRQRNTDGTFVMGEDFYRLVNFERVSPGSFLYTDGSSFNNCLINTDECEGGGMHEVIEATPPVNNPVVVEAPATAADPPPPAEDETSAEFGIDFPGLIETAAIAEEGTFDDGVTSGGDASLYSAADDEDEDEENDGAE
ncbi:MAG: beta strand repeat-containing protein [Sphingomonadaceae bacterium]